MSARHFLPAALVAASLAFTTAPVPAQDQSSHAGHTAAGAADMPSSKAFAAANDRMHTDMAIAYSGDADVDFVKGMIPHHQGAIDMAKVVLEHGKDPEIRKLAEEVIAAQTGEIKMMQDWLKARGH